MEGKNGKSEDSVVKPEFTLSHWSVRMLAAVCFLQTKMELSPVLILSPHSISCDCPTTLEDRNGWRGPNGYWQPLPTA